MIHWDGVAAAVVVALYAALIIGWAVLVIRNWRND